jgi:DNA repair protein RadC
MAGERGWKALHSELQRTRNIPTWRSHMNIRTLKKELNYKIPQLKLALIRENSVKTVQIRTPDDLYQYTEPLRHLAEEHFVCYHLDCHHHLIGCHVVSHGTLTASLVHPREVYKCAMLSNANSIIVAHNHPSGSLTPSDDDIATTSQLIQAGRLLGIELIDHLIISFSGIRSIREFYPHLWVK